MLEGGGVMPIYNCMDWKKYGGGGGGYAKISYGLEKMLGGGLMPKYFNDLKKCWGVEKCLGGMPTNFVYGLEKMFLLLYAKIFRDLKKCWRMGDYAQIFYKLEKVGVGGEGCANKFYGLKKCWGGGISKYFRI